MMSKKESITALEISAKNIFERFPIKSLNKTHVLKTKSYAWLVDKQISWMSTREPEIESNHEFVMNATGDVLIGGFGMGLILHPLLCMPHVRSITIIEKSRDIIDLFKYFYVSEKLRVVNADIFSWTTQDMFDTIYFDIWLASEPDYIEQMAHLKARFSPNLKTGGWIDSWRISK